MRESNEFQEKSAEEVMRSVSKYSRYWMLFLFLTTAGLITAYIYLRYTVPVYETSSKVLIKDERKGIDESSILESMDFFGAKKIVENEIEIIKSVELVTQVVKTLGLYAPIYREERMRNVSAYVYSPVLLEVQNTDSILQVDKVYFAYDSSDNTVNFEDDIYKVGEWHNTQYGKLRFKLNPNYQRPSEYRRLYFSLKNIYGVATELLDRIQVEAASKQASIVYIRLKDNVPKRAENIIDELVAVYNSASITDKNSLATNTLDFINSRLFHVVRELDSVEHLIEGFKTKYNIVDISEQGRMFLESANKTDEEIGKNSVQLAVLDEVQKYIDDKGGTTRVIPSTLGVSDPILSELLTKYYLVEAKMEALRSSTAGNNPIIISLRNELVALKPKIEETIKSQRKSLLIGTEAVNSQKSKYETMLSSIPDKERELIQISRQQSIKNNIYSFLLQKREETAISLAATVADSRLIDRAHTKLVPSAPNTKMIYILCVGGFFLFGFILVNALDLINKKVRFRSEIEELTQFPVVAEIYKSKNALINSGSMRSIVAEQFRQLRSSLSFLGINAKKKKLLVTSSISGEGKSFISSNLAIALAATGRKVALLEMDLRKPRLSATMGVSADKGISSYLAGEVDEIHPITYRVPNVDNLYLIAAGRIPPNPAELLLKEELPTLISQLESEYDFILIDSAPLGPVADAAIISAHVDACLFVIRQGVTPRQMVKNLLRVFKVHSIRNVSLVFNGISNRGISRYGYTYSDKYYLEDSVGSAKHNSKG